MLSCRKFLFRRIIMINNLPYVKDPIVPKKPHWKCIEEIFLRDNLIYMQDPFIFLFSSKPLAVTDQCVYYVVILYEYSITLFLNHCTLILVAHRE